MFLSQRATQAEYCDQPDLPLIEVASHNGRFVRINRWLGSANVGDLSIVAS
jgi:hypothetical protein